MRFKKKQLLNEIDNAVALLTKYKDSALDLDYFENSVVFAFVKTNQFFPLTNVTFVIFYREIYTLDKCGF